MANTIQVNNNTSLYNSGNGTPLPINSNVYANNAVIANNLSVGGFIVANGSITTDSNFVGNLIGNVTGDVFGNVYGNISGNIVIPGGNTQVIYNNDGVTGASPAFTFNQASNVVSVTGNIAGQYFIGNGSQLTGITAGTNYSNANVAAYLPVYSGNIGADSITASNTITGNTVVAASLLSASEITATGNITGSYILGNGSQLTGIPAGYSNANVDAYLPVYSGNIAANFVSATGNVTALNLKTSGPQGNIVGANYVSANFYLGDGGLLSNISSSYGNAQVAAYLTTYTGNITAGTISATGNITGTYFIGNGSQLTGLPSGYSNADVNAHLAAFGSNAISTTGNVTAGNFVGDGSQLTNLPVQPGTYSNANVQGYLAAFGSNAISTTGNITAANFVGNIAGGNVVGAVANATYATSAGSATTAGTANTATTAGTANTATSATTAGTVTGNAQANITSVGTLSSLAVSGAITAASISTTGNVTGNYIIGDGSLLTNLSGGSYGNANVANYLPTFSGNLSAGNASVTGQVAITTGSNTWRIQNQRINSPAGGEWFSDVGNLDEYITSAPNGYIDLQSLYANSAVASLIHLEHGLAHLNVNGDQWTFQNGNLTLPGNSSSVNYANGVSILSGLASTYGNANVADFLANAFGSNTVTTTGNITAANFLGNIAASNVVGTVANATYATSAGSATTATSANTATSATTAGTVTGNAQGNITSVGTLTDLSVSGNIATGTVSATGNITGSYFIGNGSQLTGLPAGYSNSDVNSHLAAFGSNTISTTGNVTAGYFIGDGSLLTNIPTGNATLSGNLAGNLQGNGFGANAFSFVSAVGNISGNYFIGNGSQLTGITATASAGGSDTQIQFNDGTALAGNAAMTFNKTTGIINLGNITMSNQVLNTANANIDVANISAFANATPWRIIMGNAYNGSANSIYAASAPGNVLNGMSPRVLMSDLIYIGNNTARVSELTVQNWYVANANVTNGSGRYTGIRTETMFGGGPSGNIINISPIFGGIGQSSVVFVGAGTNANLSAVGNTSGNSQGYIGIFSSPQVNNYSSANSIIGFLSQTQTNNANASAFGNATHQIGYYSIFSGSPANANITATTTAAAFYNPGTTGVFGTIGTNGNIARQASSYHAFRNDDNLAKAKLGMLDSFHEFAPNTATTTGTVNISKTDGQVQTIYPTGNITIGTFSNFVTRVQKPDATQTNTADTVTLVIQQGATPYTVTMPTGNANIRYAGGVSTVASTANTTTMISITGVYNYNTSSNQYLVTISPEFA